MTVEDLVRLLQHLHQAFGFLPESHFEILGIVKDLPLWLLQVPRHSRWFRAPFHFILFQSITYHSGYPGLVLFVLSVDLRLIFFL